MARRLIALVVAVSLSPFSAAAQDLATTPAPPPADPPGCALHPAPGCRYFGVTDLGFAFGATHKPTRPIFETNEPPREMFLEFGVMRNIDSHNAVGVTWFGTFDNNGGSTGPGLRYHRWLTNLHSLDVGVAVPIASSYDAGTIFGQVRYSPNQLIGLTIRPERIRHTKFECLNGLCTPQSEDYLRVMIGGDLSGKAGAVIAAWYGVAVGVMLVLLMLAFSNQH